jgi:hypothetical protein
VPEEKSIGTPEVHRPSVGPVKARPLVPSTFLPIEVDTQTDESRFFCA